MASTHPPEKPRPISPNQSASTHFFPPNQQHRLHPLILAQPSDQSLNSWSQPARRIFVSSSPLHPHQLSRKCFPRRERPQWPCEVRQIESPKLYLKAPLANLTAAAKPATAIVPFRAVAFAAQRRDASSLTPHSVSGLTKPRKEVPLPSEEGTKGVIQYALYVLFPPRYARRFFCFPRFARLFLIFLASLDATAKA